MKMKRENLHKFEELFSRSKIKITSLGLAAVMAVTMAGCTVSRDNDKNPVNNETITSTTLEVTSPNVTSPSEVTEAAEVKIPETPKVEVANITYEELMNEFYASIEKFDDATQDYLKSIFSIAYSNADDLIDTLSPLGIPNKNVFFQEKIVKSLEKIDFFKVVLEETDEYEELREKYETSRYVMEENGIYMFVTGWNQSEQIQVALEEIIHAGQDNLIKANIDFATFEILTEGEANLYSWALAFGNINNDSLDFFRYKDNDKDLFQMYGSGHNDHSIASKYYIYLMSLVGYDVMNEMRNKYNPSLLITKLSSSYQLDGEKLLNDMADVMVDAACGIEDGRTDMMLNVEKTFNKCLEKEVSKLDNKKDVKDFIIPSISQDNNSKEKQTVETIRNKTFTRR